MLPATHSARSRFIDIDGVRTHFLEAGEGFPTVLLHSGEYGASAELSWEYNIDALAVHFRVIAMDWLGFGQTDKLYDFAGGSGRRIAHLRRFLDVLCIDDAHFIGSSMGASVLAREVASRSSRLPVRAMVLSAGGGFVPSNPAREVVVDYDCTLEGMRRIVEVLFHDQAWPKDEGYVRRRHESSLTPGAWEVAAAARFRSPFAPPSNAIGRPDTTPYEAIECPTLLIAGADDPLREPGYASALAERIPDSRAIVYEDCGHLPHIEKAGRFNIDAVKFLAG